MWPVTRGQVWQRIGAQAGRRVSLKDSGCYGLESVSTNSYIQFLKHNFLESDCIWRQFLKRYLSDLGPQNGPYSSFTKTGLFIKRGHLDTDMHREQPTWRRREKAATCKSRRQASEESNSADISTSRQNCEELSLCCSSPLVCGILLWQPQETKTLGDLYGVRDCSHGVGSKSDDARVVIYGVCVCQSFSRV